MPTTVAALLLLLFVCSHGFGGIQFGFSSQASRPYTISPAPNNLLSCFNSCPCLSICNNCLQVELYMMNMLNFLDVMVFPSEPSQLDISYFSLCVWLSFIPSLPQVISSFPWKCAGRSTKQAYWVSYATH